jgi:hypothetical protein
MLEDSLQAIASTVEGINAAIDVKVFVASQAVSDSLPVVYEFVPFDSQSVIPAPGTAVAIPKAPPLQLSDEVQVKTETASTDGSDANAKSSDAIPISTMTASTAPSTPAPEASPALRALLEDKEKRIAFHAFVNEDARVPATARVALQFYSDVSMFKSLNGSASESARCANSMYQRYFAEGAPELLPLSHDVRGAIVNHVLQDQLQLSTFDGALLCVLRDLELVYRLWGEQPTAKSPRVAPKPPVAVPSPPPSLVLLDRPPTDLMMDELLGGSDDELLNRNDNLDDLLDD